MHDIVCFVFYQSSVLVIEVIIGHDMLDTHTHIIHSCVLRHGSLIDVSTSSTVQLAVCTQCRKVQLVCSDACHQ